MNRLNHTCALALLSCGLLVAWPMRGNGQEVDAAGGGVESGGEVGSGEKKLEDLPLRLTAIVDEKRHRWDPINVGALIKGTGGFNGVMYLTMGDHEFEVEEVWEDVEEGSYRMKGMLETMKVERRLMIDRKLGAARYLDIFHNTGDEDVDVLLSYKNELAFEPAAIYTSRGRELKGSLGSRDFGFAIEAAADAGCPGVLFVVGHERSKNKPTVVVTERGEQVRLDYALKVKAGQRAALLSWVVQSEFQGGELLDEEFEPFYEDRRLVAPAVSAAHQELVVNFPAGGEILTGGADLLVAVNELCDVLELERSAELDQMRVENGSILTGEAVGGDLMVASRFGDIQVRVAEVAILQGGAGSGRGNKVFLRDGTVYCGAVSVDGLGVKGGFEVSLEMAQLDYLFYRLGERDGEFPAGTDLFVKLHSGDVIPVLGGAGVELGMVSAWGEVKVPMGEIEWIRYVRSPSPRYRVALGDGSRLTVLMDSGELKLAIGGGREVEFGATEMAAMWGAEVELPEEFGEVDEIREIEEIPVSMAAGGCLMSGNQLIAGVLADELLNVVTGATVTRVAVSDIVRMTRDGDVDGGELMPEFVIELASGDVISGILQEREMGVRSGERTWRIPVQHFQAVQQPGAPVSVEDKVEMN